MRLDLVVNGQVVDDAGVSGAQDKAVRRGRDMCAKLRDVLPRQLFEVAVQAAIGGKVVARETLSAVRKMCWPNVRRRRKP